MPHISVVAPVYNEETATLSELVSQLETALASITGDFEIILVDDGSCNDAWADIVSLAQSDRRITGIRFTRNFGQHAAIAAGIDHASGDWVVVMDSDLQDRPAVITDLYRKANEGFDVVFASPSNRSESMPYRHATRIFYRLLNFLAGQELEHQRGNFSIIRREVADAYRHIPDRDCFYAGALGWLGFRHSVVFAQQGERFAGHSTYTFMGLVSLARRVIVTFSSRLLYLAIAFGIAMACTSFIITAGIVVDKLVKPATAVSGWASVMSVILFTAGVTNIMLGLVGLYIAEMFERAKQRPIYVIRQRTSRAPREALPVRATADSSNRRGEPGKSEDTGGAGMRGT